MADTLSIRRSLRLALTQLWAYYTRSRKAGMQPFQTSGAGDVGGHQNQSEKGRDTLHGDITSFLNL